MSESQQGNSLSSLPISGFQVLFVIKVYDYLIFLSFIFLMKLSDLLTCCLVHAKICLDGGVWKGRVKFSHLNLHNHKMFPKQSDDGMIGRFTKFSNKENIYFNEKIFHVSTSKFLHPNIP